MSPPVGDLQVYFVVEKVQHCRTSLFKCFNCEILVAKARWHKELYQSILVAGTTETAIRKTSKTITLKH